MLVASTHSYVLLFSDRGRCYWLKVHEIPPGTRQARGRSLRNLVTAANDERITAFVPVRAFMFKQTRDSDLALFIRLADEERPKTRADVPTVVLIPAFVLSELQTAFQIGFLIFLPFLVIDMVVSSTLMSMGMMMLPPALVSLPFKILLFVLVDGWSLMVQGLVNSFNA